MPEYPSDRSSDGRSISAVFVQLGGSQSNDPRAIGDPRRPVRLLLIGLPEDVRATIKNLYARGFAETHEWSRPNPWAATEPATQVQLLNLPPGTVMSVCTKYFI
ncbi:MAG: hypothetical protein VKJ24_12615 [Synechococcales bacterium]|nr:hypothetical protein [Synechococcales bacterium]